MGKSISASVGVNGANRRDDVVTVQELLNCIPAIKGGAEQSLTVDGWIGPLTVGAIRKFQQQQFGWADGRVDPNNVTIAKLNELALASGGDDDPFRCTCFLPPRVPNISIGPITIQSSPPPAAPPPPPPVDPLALARADAPTSINWARAAARTLETAINQLLDAGEGRADVTPELQKCYTHFHVDLIPNNFSREVLLNQARLNYLEIIRVLSDPDYFFRAGDNRDPRAFAYAHVGMYWVDNRTYKLYYNNTYANCGPKCRSAMVLHECGHYVAKAIHYAREGPTLAGAADVPFPTDNQGHGPLHPRNYAQLFPTEALHNACTYPAFAFHCFDGNDGRPGADRINE
jgi:hypothetical protein